MTDSELILLAIKARENAYMPYSGFAVGAALLTKSGKVYKGCNIENATYTPTCCAERTAFFKAISEGEQSFDRIAVVGAMSGKEPDGICPPCGVCRQVMREFCEDDFVILLGTPDNVRSYALSEMLPFSFNADTIK